MGTRYLFSGLYKILDLFFGNCGDGCIDTTWEYLEESFFIADFAIYNVFKLLAIHICGPLDVVFEGTVSCDRIITARFW